MTDPNDNAFPDERFSGLTKREYFAAMALQGLLSNPQLDKTIAEICSLAVQTSDSLIRTLDGF